VNGERTRVTPRRGGWSRVSGPWCRPFAAWAICDRASDGKFRSFTPPARPAHRTSCQFATHFHAGVARRWLVPWLNVVVALTFFERGV